MLCKIVGIDVIGVTGHGNGGKHIWTYANLDGNKVYIDVTWGDPSEANDLTYDLSYFAVSDRALSSSHTWDRELFRFK